MDSFDYTSHATRVRFGAGRVRDVRTAVDELGARRAFVLSSAGRADAAASIRGNLGDLGAGVFAGARMHTPVEVTEEAVTAAREAEADCLIAVGGGSAIGLGKAVAARTGLPQIAIPTTYAGSEMTDIVGETASDEKTVRRDAALQPAIVIYDVELTLSLPAASSATSGVNAIAHAAEALYAPDRNPVTAMMAEEGVRALASSLPAVVDNPAGVAARTGALYGAWLCASCLRSATMGLHHRLCHLLGGRFGLPHAETHTIVLPHTLAYNAPAAPEAMVRLGRALGSGDAVAGLLALNRRLGAPEALRDVGMPQAGIDETVDAALSDAYANPRPIEREALRAVLADAWEGRPPAASR